MNPGQSKDVGSLEQVQTNRNISEGVNNTMDNFFHNPSNLHFRKECAIVPPDCCKTCGRVLLIPPHTPQTLLWGWPCCSWTSSVDSQHEYRLIWKRHLQLASVIMLYKLCLIRTAETSFGDISSINHCFLSFLLTRRG